MLNATYIYPMNICVCITYKLQIILEITYMYMYLHYIKSVFLCDIL